MHKQRRTAIGGMTRARDGKWKIQAGHSSRPIGTVSGPQVEPGAALLLPVTNAHSLNIAR